MRCKMGRGVWYRVGEEEEGEREYVKGTVRLRERGVVLVDFSQCWGKLQLCRCGRSWSSAVVALRCG